MDYQSCIVIVFTIRFDSISLYEFNVVLTPYFFAYRNGSYPAFPTQSWYPPAPMQTGIESASSSGGSTSNNDLRPYSPQQPAPSSSSDIFVTLASKR